MSTLGEDNQTKMFRREINYTKVIGLFENEHMAHMYDRQIAALNRLLRQNSEGLPLLHLKKIQTVMDLSHNQLRRGNHQFLAPICGMIERAGLPFIRNKANVEYNPETSLVICNFIEYLTGLLSSPSQYVQIAAAETLRSYSSGEGSEDDVNEEEENKNDEPAVVFDLRPSAKEFNLSIINRNGIISNISNIVGNEVGIEYGNWAGKIVSIEREMKNEEEEDEEMNLTATTAVTASRSISSYAPDPSFFLMSLMHLLREISSENKNCQKLVANGCVSSLLLLLSSPINHKHEIISIAVEIIWNLIENDASIYHTMTGTSPSSPTCSSSSSRSSSSSPSTASQILSTIEAIQVFSNLLKRLLYYGSRKHDKELRNDIMVVVSIIASKCNDRNVLFEGGFVDIVILFSTASESNIVLDAPIRNYDTAEDEDIQFKILSWRFISSIITYAGKDYSRVISKSNLVPALLEYLDNESENISMLKWTPGQFVMLQHVSLRTLYKIVPLSLDSYTNLSGNGIVANFLKEVVENPQEQGSFGDTDTLLCDVLQLLLVVAPLNPAMQTELANHEVILILINLFEDRNWSFRSRQAACLAVAALCACHEDNQVMFRRIKGIEYLVNAILNSGHDENTDTLDGNISLTVLQGILSCIVGNKRSEAKFFVLDGIRMLLDLLESCKVFMRPPIVACLADLMLNERSLVYVEMWRSEASLNNIIQLLVRLWSEEEERKHIIHEDTNIIGNIDRPLDGIRDSENNEEGNISPSSSSPNLRASNRLVHALKVDKILNPETKEDYFQAALDASDLRPKIYSIIYAMEGRDCAILENDSTINERIKLCLIKEYEAFLVGQQWQDIKSNLELNSIKPLFADMLMLEREIESAFNTASKTKGDQTNIYSEKLLREQESEQDFISLVLLQRDQSLISKSMVIGGGFPSNVTTKRSTRIQRDISPISPPKTWRTPSGPIPVTALSPGYRKGASLGSRGVAGGSRT